MFKDLHVSSGAIVRWSEHQVLSRYRFRSNVKKDGSSKPTMRVEALVLNTGNWAAVPESKKQLLSLNTSMAVKLVVMEVAWYSPIPAFRLITAMGYMRSSVDVPLPREYKYRWIIQAALKRSDRGRSAKNREEYDIYMKMDTPYSVVTNSDLPFHRPNPFGGLEAAVNYQGRPVTFWKKGKSFIGPGLKNEHPPNKTNSTQTQAVLGHGGDMEHSPFTRD